MARTLSLALAVAAAFSVPALAEDATKIEPGNGPTSTMTDKVPQMKSDAIAAPDAAKPLPAAKAVEDAVPPMRRRTRNSWQTSGVPVVAGTP
jgi:hypothetical protein